MSGWGGNDFDINPMCPCGKKLMSKNVSEFTSVTIELADTKGISWVCKKTGQSRSVNVQCPYLLGYLRKYITIVKIITIENIWVNNKLQPQPISKTYIIVPEQVEIITQPLAINIL